MVKGTFVSVSGNTVTLSHGNKPETVREVATDATITLDSKPASLTDLRPGDEVTLSGDPATLVKATR